MNILKRLTRPMNRGSGWKVAVIFGFSALLVLGLLLARANPASVAKAATGATITSDKEDYQPGATVTLTGAGWDSGEAVHIFVNDAIGNTWSLNSNPDPVADTDGSFTYSFSLASDFISNYNVTATGATSDTATTTFTDSDAACPDLSGKVQSNLVGATFSTNGSTATYTFSSFKDLSPSGGVPGLIKYCVYPANSDLPTDITPQAVGANGDAWGSTSKTDNFSFDRPGGNPTNIPLDGKTTTMGTATWSGSVPTDQTILLHINDATECKSLYSVTEDTCFVLPGSPQQQGKDLTVSKTATPSFTRTYKWSIAKSVDKSEIDIASGGSATFKYSVVASETGFTDSAWQVNGTITVNNPNSSSFSGVNITDNIAGVTGATCVINDVNGGQGETIAPGDNTFTYTCTYSSQPTYNVGINTATATWDNTTYNTPDSSASGSATFSFTTPTSMKNQTITVTDSYKGDLGTLTATDDSTSFTSKTFTYQRTETGNAGTCTTYDNTATIKETGQTTDKVSVKVCVGADLTVSKTVSPSFTRTYAWSISKSVDKKLVEQIGGGTATFNYTVNAGETGVTDSVWQVKGSINVTNPNNWEAITLTGFTDNIDNGGLCSITPGNLTVPASGSVTLDYTCNFSSNPGSGMNTATASWDKTAAYTPDGSAQGTAGYAFGAPTTKVNPKITVSDTFNGGAPTTLGTLTATDGPPYASATYTYAHTVNVPTFNCTKYTNTAAIVETGQSDSKTVEVCGPAKTGALTMGYWQNKNGQAIISGGASISGVCNSGTWLRQYAPFQDLSATAKCTDVATYVYNIIKAANASGSSMNAMLKAQMLATALDVYFSDPALGGNKIGAPAPIGGVSIDLTMICKMIDSTNGTATCSGTFENVSSAFGGATGLTVSQMIAYAASQSNMGGTSWYGQNKTTQGLAKDAFDAINNQVAFSP